jgi:hypothetical protein
MSLAGEMGTLLTAAVGAATGSYLAFRGNRRVKAFEVREAARVASIRSRLDHLDRIEQAILDGGSACNVFILEYVDIKELARTGRETEAWERRRPYVHAILRETAQLQVLIPSVADLDTREAFEGALDAFSVVARSPEYERGNFPSPDPHLQAWNDNRGKILEAAEAVGHYRMSLFEEWELVPNG